MEEPAIELSAKVESPIIDQTMANPIVNERIELSAKAESFIGLATPVTEINKSPVLITASPSQSPQTLA